jgi:hypothetical protein
VLAVAGIIQRKAPYPDLMAAVERVGTLQFLAPFYAWLGLRVRYKPDATNSLSIAACDDIDPSRL